MSTDVTVGILATLKAKPEKEKQVEEFLKGALALANQERDTTVWFALKLDVSTLAFSTPSRTIPGAKPIFPDLLPPLSCHAGKSCSLSRPKSRRLMFWPQNWLGKPLLNTFPKLQSQEHPA